MNFNIYVQYLIFHCFFFLCCLFLCTTCFPSPPYLSTTTSILKTSAKVLYKVACIDGSHLGTEREGTMSQDKGDQEQRQEPLES